MLVEKLICILLVISCVSSSGIHPINFPHPLFASPPSAPAFFPAPPVFAAPAVPAPVLPAPPVFPAPVFHPAPVAPVPVHAPLFPAPVLNQAFIPPAPVPVFPPPPAVYSAFSHVIPPPILHAHPAPLPIIPAPPAPILKTLIPGTLTQTHHTLSVGFPSVPVLKTFAPPAAILKPHFVKHHLLPPPPAAHLAFAAPSHAHLHSVNHHHLSHHGHLFG